MPGLLRAINPPGASIPGISQAMLIENGRLLVLAGHVPLRADGSIPGNFEEQLDQVFSNVQATLRAAGAGFEAVARLTIYVCEYRPEMLATIRSVRDRYVDANRPPASALIGVAALFHPDVLVEVDGLAVIPV